MSAFTALEQNALALKLVSISIRELIGLTSAPCDVYAPVDGIFDRILTKGSLLTMNLLKGLISKGLNKLYVKSEERQALRSLQQDNLRKLTRSLSIGEPIKQAKSHFNLLTINMAYLYEDPTHDETLQLQYQSIKNLAPFLLSNVNYHGRFYSEYIKLKHHFVFAQPLLSSLFLIGVAKQSRAFTEKEIESLFVTSYFKDIGMSSIPPEKYAEKSLTETDKEILARHNVESVNILKGRIPLAANYLSIIENHHLFSSLTDDLEFFKNPEGKEIFGIETVIVAAMDIMAAMISERPYRDSNTLFETLDFIKNLIGDEYPDEFKLFVSYFKSFFTS